MIRITIPIEPKAQARTHQRVIRTKAGKMVPIHYKTKPQRLSENKLIAYLVAEKNRQGFEPLTGAIALSVAAYLPIPQSWSKKRRSMALAGDILPTTKPDCSNLAKNLEDCAAGILYQDDKQIISLSISKQYNENPRWEITLNECHEKEHRGEKNE